MRYLVATDSVHTTAAACDYLLDPGRLAPDDVVHVLTVAPSDDRDAGDAANVAGARLAGRAIVETEIREADSGTAETVLSVAGEVDADVLVLGGRGGTPDSTPGLGETARAVLERASVPVVVVPLPDLS